jgi:hypothetical protein
MRSTADPTNRVNLGSCGPNMGGRTMTSEESPSDGGMSGRCGKDYQLDKLSEAIEKLEWDI